jgi:hypothetical protein
VVLVVGDAGLGGGVRLLLKVVGPADVQVAVGGSERGAAQQHHDEQRAHGGGHREALLGAGAEDQMTHAAVLF